MAAFTTALLLGLAGGMLAGKAKGGGSQQAQQSIAAPGPSNAQQTLAVPPPPMPQAQASSTGAAAGQQAAMKQRARMTPAKNNGLAPSIIRAPRPVLQANTIAGGY